FECTGLSPFDPQQILARFQTKDVSRPSTADIESVYNSHAKKLSHTIHTIVVQKTLLQHENQHLRDAFMNEKKHRQRGRALLLEAPAEYDGGAQWWSPKKVQDARAR
ncbi:hypothetical protein BU25DRAFT_352352, partial [Macroventuria anomochaeta]